MSIASDSVYDGHYEAGLSSWRANNATGKRSPSDSGCHSLDSCQSDCSLHRRSIATDDDACAYEAIYEEIRNVPKLTAAADGAAGDVDGLRFYRHEATHSLPYTSQRFLSQKSAARDSYTGYVQTLSKNYMEAVNKSSNVDGFSKSHGDSGQHCVSVFSLGKLMPNIDCPQNENEPKTNGALLTVVTPARKLHQSEPHSHKCFGKGQVVQSSPWHKKPPMGTDLEEVSKVKHMTRKSVKSSEGILAARRKVFLNNGVE